MKPKLNKIKIFSDQNIANLEKEINSWFKQNKYIEIVQILQSETLTDLTPDFKNDSFNRTITICYKETENPSLAQNESVSQTKFSNKEEISSTITEPAKSKKVSQGADDLEFLYEQVQNLPK
jgi:hypothetical protein